MKNLLLFLLLGFHAFCFAQGNSAIQEQSLRYNGMGAHGDAYWDSVRIAEGAPANVQSPISVQGSCTLNKRVFGWHPYWVGTVYTNYQWNLLSDLCYFDYAVSPTTGSNTNSSYNWLSSAAVTAAINNGVDVHICATLFGSHAAFLSNTTAQQTFINNIISDLQARGGKGVNIDFEGMTASNSTPFTTFIQNLSTQLHAAIPGSEVSMALYAVDWSNVFDIASLTPYVDLFIVMGYDYYWSGSTTAGPDDPLYNFQTSYNYTLTRSITFYLAQGMPSNKLLLGLPYYGREWETTASTVPSATTGNFSSSRTFSVIMNNANGYYSVPQYEPISFTPYYSFQVSSAWRQCFWENSYSMKRRFDVVNQRNLGGIGIWALGYDDGFNDYWNAISERFSSCASVACTDTLWDMGGPARNYYNNEDYVTTIAPTGATQVTLAFSQFSMELNFDSLYIYDGPDDTYPLIGAYTGTNSPGTITSTGSSLAIKVHTNGGTVAPGFTAVWSCMIDNVPPVVAISQPAGWVTQSFNTSWTDTDVGSGVDRAYYQCAGYNGTEWRSNRSAGFFTDDFSTGTIHSDWTAYSGNWNATAGRLEQTDEANTNTSLSAPLNQNAGNGYLYHWQGKIDGSGSNRRAGLHFFADSASLPNRGNGYFVWFRVDQSALEFYEVTNDVFTLRHSVPMTVNAGQWYDWKVTYNPANGLMEVYRDNAFIGAWTDGTPYTSGNCVSFRSGNSNWQVEDFRVYRSRMANGTSSITVGNCAGCYLQNENYSPSIAGGQIRSLSIDSMRNISATANIYLDIDWTAAMITQPVDGNAGDIDTTSNLTLIEGNWNFATDTNSGVNAHWYCIGTTPGDSDFVAWANNGFNTSFSIATTLTQGQWYYIGLRVENGAGLFTPIDTSDGQVADIGLGINENSGNWMLYPNPVQDVVTLASDNTSNAELIQIFDADGKLVLYLKVPLSRSMNAPIEVNVSSLAPGTYLLELSGENLHMVTPLIKQ